MMAMDGTPTDGREPNQPTKENGMKTMRRLLLTAIALASLSGLALGANYSGTSGSQSGSSSQSDKDTGYSSGGSTEDSSGQSGSGAGGSSDTDRSDYGRDPSSSDSSGHRSGTTSGSGTGGYSDTDTGVRQQKDQKGNEYPGGKNHETDQNIQQNK